MSKSYKKPKTPYLILIGLFLLLAAFDSLYVESGNDRTVVIPVESNQAPETERPGEFQLADYLIDLQSDG